MNYKYCKLIVEEFKKYYKNYYEFDYDKTIKMCLKFYHKLSKEKNISANELSGFKYDLFYFILILSYHLDKKELKKYILTFKHNKFYKIFSGETPDLLIPKIKYWLHLKHWPNILILKFFPSICFKRFLLKNGYYSFKNKKSIRKKQYYYFGMGDKLSVKLKKIFRGYLSLDYIELVVTTKCTLRCKDCANLMHKYKKPYDVDLNTIKLSIQKLLSCVDSIDSFRILGGEPFINPYLKDILKELTSPKLKKIVIVTNGTFVPKDKELIRQLQRENVYIEISDYDKLSYNKEKLIEFLKENKINGGLHNGIYYWVDYGEVKPYNNNTYYQFSHCDNNCKSLLNGKIYYCPRQSHGIDLGIIKDNKNEYIDLLNNTDKENKKLLKQYMFRNEPISACKYCKYATKDCKIIDMAVQERINI